MLKRLSRNKDANTKLVTGIITLLLVIIVALVIFWNVSPNLISTDAISETFTGYSHGDNASAQVVVLDDVPDSITNVTCFSATAGTLSYPTTSFSNRQLTVGTCSNYTQINVTYASEKAVSAGASNDMWSTIMPLMVIIALVLVAGVIIGIISKFGE